ncbi:MAG: putative type oligopeptide transport system, permease component [Ramlibacter sp.]|nr:putative type oligopeptide transport system, permease component [Ramlibacter sp.]
MSGWTRVSNSTSATLVADPAVAGQTQGGGAAPVPAEAAWVHVSPTRRAWRRFRRNKLGFYSLVVFLSVVILSLFAEVL